MYPNTINMINKATTTKTIMTTQPVELECEVTAVVEGISDVSVVGFREAEVL